MTTDKLLVKDGENRAVRMFLALYSGFTAVTVGQMKIHLRMAGFGHWPDWVEREPGSAHLTKGGAQLWLRHLFDLELPTTIVPNGAPELTPADGITETNKAPHPDGGYTFGHVAAWTEPLVKAYGAACRAQGLREGLERAAEICVEKDTLASAYRVITRAAAEIGRAAAKG